MENNNFNNNPMKPEENIEKIENKPETPVTPEVSAPAQENVTEPKVEVNINQPKVEVNIGQPEVKVTIEQPKVEPVTEQVKPESKIQKFKTSFKDKMGKFKNFAKKRKPLVIAVSALLVAGITTGVTVGAIAANGGFVAPVNDKFDKMKAYYKDYLIRNTNIDNYKKLSAAQILKRGVYWKTIDDEKIYTKLIKKQIAGVTTYYMEGVDYEDGRDRNAWPASSHVSQNLAIAVTATVKHDPEMMKIATGMLYYWVYNNFRNTNWWHNELGAGANSLANVGIFVYDHLNSLGKTLFVSKVAKASFYYRPSLLTHSGTNLFDYADITLRSSIFTKNEDEFQVVVKRIQDEITDEHLEGFQRDGSFFQHGQQVQIASYGKGVIRLAKVLKAISVSGVKFSEEKMNIIERYILTGLRNMTHKGYINYSSVSREYVRKNNLSASANNFSQFSEYLDIPDFTRHDELKAYLDSIENKQPSVNEGELTYFNNARMITLNSGGLYMSFKGTADYLTNTECVNGENKLGLNLSYGTNTCVMDDGDEYYNISPLWNYAYIPGTTSIQLVDDAHKGTQFTDPTSVDDTIYTKMVHDIYKDELYEGRLPEQTIANDVLYAGGLYPDNTNDVTETKVAVSMQRSVHHDENSFTVTCVACKDGMLLLGADLKYDGTKTSTVFQNQEARKLHTTIEQCFYKGDDKFQYLDEGKAMIHGNAIYKIVDVQGQNADDKKIAQPQIVDLSLPHGWERNRVKDSATEDVKASGKVLLAYIQHDSATDESYSYSIQPTSLKDKDFIVYSNFSNMYGKTQAVQEVGLPDGKTVIISYTTHNDLEEGYKDHFYSQDPSEKHIHKLKKGQVIILE